MTRVGLVATAHYLPERWMSAAEGGAALRTDTAPGRREMNIAVLKTKAEQSLAEAFGSVAADLPEGSWI